jgi:D-inositol-3-phosphate glycosyltransferase
VKALGGDPESQFREAAEAEVIGCSDAICVSCTEEERQFVSLYGRPPGNLEIVAPGVEHAFFAPGDKGGARHALDLSGGPVLLFVGRIQPLKGVDVAVQALAELRRPDATLIIVGGASGDDGDAELQRLHDLIDSCGVTDQVRFVEAQPHHMLSTYYRAADVVVVPSRSESFGLVALEAAACGTPVVASAVGGLLTLIDHGRN